MNAVITGVGDYLPSTVWTNDDVAQKVDTSDEWVRTRTGITQRHVLAEGETTSDMAYSAAQAALKKACVDAQDIDLIIVSTSTPDSTMPSTACLLQNKLGNHGAMAFDVNAACSGFVYGLQLVNSLLQSGQYQRALLIGADAMSKIVDWQDRATCVLFGDGAGAVVIEAQENDAGILACQTQADGQYASILGTDGGVSCSGAAGVLHMLGKEVFRHGVEKMAGITQEVLHSLQLNIDQLDWVIPHQANLRIIDAIAKKLGVPNERFVTTLQHHANTSAASIPLALATAVRDGRIKNNDLIALPALGAGLTWGCCIIKWNIQA